MKTDRLTEFKINDLRAWRSEVRADLKEIHDTVDKLDKKNDKGFSDLNLKLVTINDFMKTYKETDQPRIERLEKGVIVGAVGLITALAAVVWDIFWGHFKP